jgi:hypothetical protein
MLYSPAFRYTAHKPTGAKLALKPFHVWGIRVRLQVSHRIRDLALFDLALDRKLRGCDLISLKVSDLLSPSGVKRRVVMQAMRSGLPSNISAGQFAVEIHYAGFLYIPRPSRRTYDEVISTGNLGLLRSETAKRAIAEYYASWGDMRQWDELLRLQQSRYWELTAGVLPRSALKAAIREREPKLSPTEAAEVLSRLRNGDGVEDSLTGMAAHQERIRRDSEKLRKQGRKLIDELTSMGRS